MGMATIGNGLSIKKYQTILLSNGNKNGQYLQIDPNTHARIYETWDFLESESYKWLKEKCKGNWSWDWGFDLGDGRHSIDIYFHNFDDAETFRQSKYFCNLNIESSFFIENFTFKLSEDIDCFDELEKIINWCRENLNSSWNYVIRDEQYNFKFKDEDDAIAFKIKWYEFIDY